MKIFSGMQTPNLYSFQTSLPNLPLPSVKDTMKRVSSEMFKLINIKINAYCLHLLINVNHFADGFIVQGVILVFVSSEVHCVRGLLTH